jgi:hypothetical protein
LVFQTTGDVVAADEIFILLLVLVFVGWIVVMAVRSRRQDTADSPEISAVPDKPAPPETRPADVQPAEQPQLGRRR